MGEICSLGSQYLSGFITGGALCWIFSQLFHKKIVRALCSDKTYLKRRERSLEDIPVCGCCAENGKCTLCHFCGGPYGDCSSETCKGEESWLPPPTKIQTESVSDSCRVAEIEKDRASSETPDENVIYLRLTDKTLQKLLASKLQSFLDEDDVLPEPVTRQPTFSTSVSTPAPITTTKTTIVDDGGELTNIFEQTVKTQTRDPKETLALGKNLGAQPTAYPTSKGGGYLTMSQLSEIGAKNEVYKNNMLSRADELEIIHLFRGIVGMSLTQAQSEAGRQGYTVHPLYVGTGEKMPAMKYSGTTLGVRVKDEKFDPATKKISPFATVTEIIDVGGVDAKDHGKVRL